jgi:predicted nucleotidyltransferase
MRLGDAIQNSPYRAGVRSVALFGSQLHDTAKNDSGVNMLIGFDPRATMPYSGSSRSRSGSRRHSADTRTC